MEENNNIESLDDNKVETLDSSTPETLEEAPKVEEAPAPVEVAPVPVAEPAPEPEPTPEPAPAPEPVKEEPKKGPSKDEKKRLIMIGGAGVVLIVIAILASFFLNSKPASQEKPKDPETPKQVKLSDDEVKAILDNYNFRYDGISIDGDECIGDYAFLLVPAGFTVDTLPSEYVAIYIGKYFIYNNPDKDTMTDEEYIAIGKKLFGKNYEAELVDKVERVVFMDHDINTNSYSIVNGETNYQCINATVVSKIMSNTVVGNKLIVNVNAAYTILDDDAVYMYKDYNKTMIIGTGNLGKVEYGKVLERDGSTYRFEFDKDGDNYTFNSVNLSN